MNNDLHKTLPTMFPQLEWSELIHSYCPPGWMPILQTALSKLSNLSVTNGKVIEIHQVKEKFGGLVIYTNMYSPEIAQIVNDASSESYKTCEVCGSPGRLRTTRPGGSRAGWHKTLCDECAKQQNYE